MELIELSPIPNQEFQCILEKQNCTIHIYERAEHVFFDLTVKNEIMTRGELVIPRQAIITNPCSFKGNFWIVDLTSAHDRQSNPHYPDFGTRFVLFYLSESEVSELEAWDGN